MTRLVKRIGTLRSLIRLFWIGIGTGGANSLHIHLAAPKPGPAMLALIAWMLSLWPSTQSTSVLPSNR